MTTKITMTCKPFTSEQRGSYRLTVDDAGIVRVWDSVAGHYTTCHSLSPRSQAAARTKAGWEPDCEALMIAAGEAGDEGHIELCRRAIGGSKRALGAIRRMQAEAATAATCAHWCEGRR